MVFGVVVSVSYFRCHPALIESSASALNIPTILSLGFQGVVPKLIGRPALISWANHLARTSGFSTKGMSSKKFADVHSPLMVARKSSILRPRVSSSILCASSITTKARGRGIFLLRITSCNFSGVATNTSNASARSVCAKSSSSKASISMAPVNCSTLTPIGSKSRRSLLVIWAVSALVGAT